MAKNNRETWYFRCSNCGGDNTTKRNKFPKCFHCGTPFRVTQLEEKGNPHPRIIATVEKRKK